NSFGTSGRAYPVWNSGRGSELFTGFSLQADDKVIVVASTYDTTAPNRHEDIGIMRLTSNGLVDGTLTAGIFDLNNSNDYGSNAALEPDGKIIVSGATGNDFMVLRFTSGVSGIEETQS